ncbi:MULTISPECIES: hypothetical protein [Reichenbachiella]|uniref:TFIIE alpha subunit n=1 Tax=Reichenbachiella agariperforans TaxID=156994 RepID=A0A1M6LD56_REIAG|nr:MULTISPECIES: hypothetical protein [Reichenbachiella]MBU2913882.1 hypothetical protein [Reichenbachiella agariperforans]RJE74203.1 hypothetical protein BGP76_13515 [Reichenbachiella sp. MSK19-1]SHJ69139.1 hypothetical protein SAMN04488028_101920 [Reichenbachiella agariperforans]
MSDHEYDVLDELYFLVSFQELKTSVGMEEDELLSVLTKLQKKDWIKCFEEPDVELESKDVDLEINFRKYHYLATKTGLKAHTSTT